MYSNNHPIFQQPLLVQQPKTRTAMKGGKNEGKNVPENNKWEKRFQKVAREGEEGKIQCIKEHRKRETTKGGWEITTQRQTFSKYDSLRCR